MRKFEKIIVTLLGIGFCCIVILFLLQGIGDAKANQMARRHHKEYLTKVGSHNEDISVIVDFSIPSYAKRMFVFDNRNLGIEISSSKCAHGAGGGSTLWKPVFSNEPGSECSSLGTYRLTRNDTMHNIGAPCIRLEGLDSSNSNAAARGIVIHEGPVLADGISVGLPIPVSRYISQGCFTISSYTLSMLRYLMNSGASVYLYAIYPEDDK